MATQGRNGKIHGKINNLVYRQLGDQQIIQIAPARVRQTYATKLNALEFGLASAHAKVLRDIFRKIYEKSDGKMNGRLNATVAACLRTSHNEVGERTLHDSELDQLCGFQFNLDAPIENLLSVRPVYGVEPDGSFRFKLPAFNLSSDVLYPPEDFQLDPSFTIALIAVQFEKEFVQLIDHHTYEFENLNRIQEIDWVCRRQLPQDTIVMAVFTLRYSSENWIGKKISTTDKAFYPTVIVHAFHVTPALAECGIMEGFDPPIEEEEHFGHMVNQSLAKIKKFKEKAAKKKK